MHRFRKAYGNRQSRLYVLWFNFSHICACFLKAYRCGKNWAIPPEIIGCSVANNSSKRTMGNNQEVWRMADIQKNSKWHQLTNSNVFNGLTDNRDTITTSSTIAMFWLWSVKVTSFVIDVSIFVKLSQCSHNNDVSYLLFGSNIY